MTDDINLPFFLRPGYHVTSESQTELDSAIERYEEQFGEGTLTTEPFSFSEEEWVRILNECIRRNETFEDYLGIEYDPNADY